MLDPANEMEGKFTHYADEPGSIAPGMANLVGGAVFPLVSRRDDPPHPFFRVLSGRSTGADG